MSIVVNFVPIYSLAVFNWLNGYRFLKEKLVNKVLVHVLSQPEVECSLFLLKF